MIKTEGRLFMIGSAPFESLTELINHYQKYPLYRKTKLKYPCNQSVGIHDMCTQQRIHDMCTQQRFRFGVRRSK